MNKEEARSFLIDISYKLGNMSVEYLTEKDGEKMREAIKALEQEPKIVNLGDNVVYGTDGNLYKITVSSGKALEQEPCEEELDFVQEHKKISCNLIVEPCEDCISRQAVIKCLERGDTLSSIDHRLIDQIKGLPPVNPQLKIGHWIPVSERLPEENKTVIASTTYGVYPEAKYTEEYGWEWAYESGADYWKELVDKVEAWMPLPKRYEP